MGDDPDDFVNRFVNSPQRPIGARIGRAKKTPHGKAKAEIVAALHDLPGNKLIEVRSVGLVKYKTGGKERQYTYGRPGEADLRVTWRPPVWPYPAPLSIAIEIKVGRDTQSGKQSGWQGKAEAAGIAYFIVGTGREALDAAIGLWRAVVPK
jgi:hypothetical protein